VPKELLQAAQPATWQESMVSLEQARGARLDIMKLQRNKRRQRKQQAVVSRPRSNE
jgi:hypothetical protein